MFLGILISIIVSAVWVTCITPVIMLFTGACAMSVGGPNVSDKELFLAAALPVLAMILAYIGVPALIFYVIL